MAKKPTRKTKTVAARKSQAVKRSAPVKAKVKAKAVPVAKRGKAVTATGIASLARAPLPGRIDRPRPSAPRVGLGEPGTVQPLAVTDWSGMILKSRCTIFGAMLDYAGAAPSSMELSSICL